MAKKKPIKKDDIPRKTLKEILQDLEVEEEQINRLSEAIQETVFIDNYVKKEEESEDILKLTNHNIVTGEENYLYVNFNESTLDYHDICNGVNRIRHYTTGGFDLSLINQL